tara:strand:+ start:1205 stop:1621 length:417 start_codon:yes stop_codon:yes gene_type:complete
MSFKAYIFALPDKNQVDILSKFMSVMNTDDDYNPAYLEFFYKVTSNFPVGGKTYPPGTILAAITVDRGDLMDSLINETEAYQPSDDNMEDWPSYSMLEDYEVSIMDDGSSRLVDAEMFEIEPLYKWPDKVLEMIGGAV